MLVQPSQRVKDGLKKFGGKGIKRACRRHYFAQHFYISQCKKAHNVTAWWRRIRKQDIWNLLSNILPNVRYLISEECCKFLTIGGGKETIIYFRIYKAVYC